MWSIPMRHSTFYCWYFKPLFIILCSFFTLFYQRFRRAVLRDDAWPDKKDVELFANGTTGDEGTQRRAGFHKSRSPLLPLFFGVVENDVNPAVFLLLL